MRNSFAQLDKKLLRAIASKGGRNQGKHNNSGNFANDKRKAKLAGSKGGKHSRAMSPKRIKLLKHWGLPLKGRIAINHVHSQATWIHGKRGNFKYVYLGVCTKEGFKRKRIY